MKLSLISIFLIGSVSAYELIYDRSPSLSVVTTDIDYDTADLDVELTVQGKSLKSGRDFTVNKIGDGLSFQLETK